MEIEVKEEKDNPFFERKELVLELKHPNSKTPSKLELMKELTSKYSAPEENILIDYIFTKKGISRSIAKAKIYKKKPKVKKKKVEEKKEKTKPKKEAKPKEKAKPEAKAEKKKKEKKPEEKPKEEKKEIKSETQTSEEK